MLIVESFLRLSYLATITKYMVLFSNIIDNQYFLFQYFYVWCPRLADERTDNAFGGLGNHGHVIYLRSLAVHINNRYSATIEQMLYQRNIDR